MKLRLLLLGIILGWTVSTGQSQDRTTVKVWSFEDLEQYINSPSHKLRVINFWATWCAPCIKELPFFEEISTNQKGDVEVILISLDFADLLESKVIPFVERKGITANTVLLADENYNVWIDKVDPSWSGALPATLFITASSDKVFYEQEFEREELFDTIKKLNTKK